MGILFAAGRMRSNILTISVYWWRQTENSEKYLRPIPSQRIIEYEDYVL